MSVQKDHLASKQEQKELWFGGKEVLMIYIRLYLPALFHKLAPRVKPL
jgi:hypothetical protein